MSPRARPQSDKNGSGTAKRQKTKLRSTKKRAKCGALFAVNNAEKIIVNAKSGQAIS